MSTNITKNGNCNTNRCNNIIILLYNLFAVFAKIIDFYDNSSKNIKITELRQKYRLIYLKKHLYLSQF